MTNLVAQAVMKPLFFLFCIYAPNLCRPDDRLRFLELSYVHLSKGSAALRMGLCDGYRIVRVETDIARRVSEAGRR
jgi:hypothetical protein